MKVYGLTLQQYDDLLQSQGGVCAICQKPPKPGTNLAVEHDHVTGYIRGLACFYCNRRLIGRHRDPELLRRIANYISRHTGLKVPMKQKKKRRKRQ